MVNKEITGSYNDTVFTGYRYNRVAGLEYNFATADNRWQGKTFYHQSFIPERVKMLPLFPEISAIPHST